FGPYSITNSQPVLCEAIASVSCFNLTSGFSQTSTTSNVFRSPFLQEKMKQRDNINNIYFFMILLIKSYPYLAIFHAHKIKLLIPSFKYVKTLRIKPDLILFSSYFFKFGTWG